MGMFGGGFSHGLGIDDATTGRGSGGYGQVGGRSFGDYMSSNSRASRERRAARARAAAAAAKEAARVAAVKAEKARIKESKRKIVERDVRLAYEAATAISDNFNNSLAGRIAGFFGFKEVPSPLGGGVVDTTLSFNPLTLAANIFAPTRVAAAIGLLDIPSRLGVPDITLASFPVSIDTLISNGPSLASPGIDAGFSAAGLSGNGRTGEGSSRPSRDIIASSVFSAEVPSSAVVAAPVAASSALGGISESSSVLQAPGVQTGPALASVAIPGPQSLPISGQATEKRSVWPELITAAAVAVELS